MISTYQTPNVRCRELIQMGRLVDAMREWRFQHHECVDGTRVKPNIRTARDAVLAWSKGMPMDIRITISMDSCRIVE